MQLSYLVWSKHETLKNKTKPFHYIDAHFAITITIEFAFCTALYQALAYNQEGARKCWSNKGVIFLSTFDQKQRFWMPLEIFWFGKTEILLWIDCFRKIFKHAPAQCWDSKLQGFWTWQSGWNSLSLCSLDCVAIFHCSSTSSRSSSSSSFGSC